MNFLQCPKCKNVFPKTYKGSAIIPLKKQDGNIVAAHNHCWETMVEVGDEFAPCANKNHQWVETSHEHYRAIGNGLTAFTGTSFARECRVCGLFEARAWLVR